MLVLKLFNNLLFLQSGNFDEAWNLVNPEKTGKYLLCNKTLWTFFLCYVKSALDHRVHSEMHSIVRSRNYTLVAIYFQNMISPYYQLWKQDVVVVPLQNYTGRTLDRWGCKERTQGIYGKHLEPCATMTLAGFSPDHINWFLRKKTLAQVVSWKYIQNVSLILYAI